MYQSRGNPAPVLRQAQSVRIITPEETAKPQGGLGVEKPKIQNPGIPSKGTALPNQQTTNPSVYKQVNNQGGERIKLRTAPLPQDKKRQANPSLPGNVITPGSRFSDLPGSYGENQNYWMATSQWHANPVSARYSSTVLEGDTKPLLDLAELSENYSSSTHIHVPVVEGYDGYE